LNDVWLGVAGIITPLLAGLVAALIALWNARHKIRQEEDTTTAARQNQIIDRLEHQVERLDRQIQEQQSVINRQQEMNAEYREESAELRTVLQFLYDLAHRFHSDLTAANLAREPMPSMPRLRQRSLPREAESPEFMARTTQQNTDLLQKVDEHMKSTAPSKPGAAP
jgi:predicted RNase H-like nuclease (RuvC/YqgF family)